MNSIPTIVKVFLVFLSLLWSADLYSQVINYDIVKGGSVIGSMTAEKKVSGNQVDYKIKSVTHFRVVVKLTVDYNLTETYVGGVLQSGNALSTLNGATQNQSDVQKRDGYYRIETDSDIIEFDSDAIRYSIPEIYFNEPIGKKYVFSQVFATNLEIEDVGNHTYEMESEDGLNVYTYRNGICTEVKVSRSYATFYIRIKE
ncbi:hypothetical protein N6H18_03150 [Reichenbachiella agarivorans]|uniref:DUF3108 domain-containing protein n=1 Tax=Reichenbachiella agarivorans TaxID=2979464 RepID=A0ABY6CR08_9BACT|nr:DUF6134 family protein [Reichenbachiella agarivorans]UXP32951.1 hypothetical protein N6H18_03150 [Reichenbachiella agarivorans]